MAGAVGFIGAHGVESGPLPNMAVTTMGVVWIGLLGAYAALILRFSTAFVSNDIGTDTLFMLALGVAANDVGALVVGSAVGRTPLRPWVSPSKTLEGLLGGSPGHDHRPVHRQQDQHRGHLDRRRPTCSCSAS